MDKDIVERKIDELAEVVVFIKDHMATKTDLAEVKDRVTSIEGKLDGINNRIDLEVDKRKTLEVRTTKLEQKVFGKN